MAYEFMVLYSYILYVSGKSVYQSPLLRLLFITLTYAEPQPIDSVSDLLKKIRNNSFGISDGVHILQRVATTSLEFGAFFLQFLSWWTQEHNHMNLITLPIPPPPAVKKIIYRQSEASTMPRKVYKISSLLIACYYYF